MQTEARVVLDLFRLQSDHLMVDPARKKLWLIDTNNLVDLRREVAQNRLFRSVCSLEATQVTADDLHQALGRLCEKHGFDTKHFFCAGPPVDIKEMRVLVDLGQCFPAGDADNSYIRAVKAAFALEDR